MTTQYKGAGIDYRSMSLRPLMLTRPTVRRLFKVGLTALAVCIGIPLIALALLFITVRAAPTSLQRPLEIGLGWVLARNVEIGELNALRIGNDLRLYLAVSSVRVSNPEWAEEPFLLSLDHLVLDMDGRSFWRTGPAIIDELQVSGARLVLLAPAGQSPNWQFWWHDDHGTALPDALEPELPLIIHEFSVDRGEILYRDPDQAVVARVDRLRAADSGKDTPVTLEMDGSVNDLPLQAHGNLGPSRALLTGRDIVGDMSIVWGPLRADMRGHVAELAALTGVDIELTLASPHARALLDALGMPEIRDAPLDIQTRIRDGNPGLQIQAAASLGPFTGRLDGRLTEPLELDGVTLSIDLEGPSLAEAGAAFDIVGLRDVPYALSMAVLRDESRVEISRGRLVAADGVLDLTGYLPNFPAIDDWHANASGHRLNLGIFSAALGFPALRDRSYDVAVQLASEQGRETVDLEVSDASSGLRLSGVVGDGRELQGTQLSLELTGDDLTGAGRSLGFANLPGGPYRFAAQLAKDATSWRIREGVFTGGDVRFDVNGRVDIDAGPAEFDLQLAAATGDLSRLLRYFGIASDPIPSRPLQLEGMFRGTLEQLAVEDVRMTSGQAKGVFNGTLGELRNLHGMKLEFALRGPDLAEFLPGVANQAALPFDLDGLLTRQTSGWQLPRLEGRIAGASMRMNTSVKADSGTRSTELQLDVAGEDIGRVLAPWSASRSTAPFSLHVAAQHAGELFQLRELRARAGNMELSAELQIDNPPDFSASRGSAQLSGPSGKELQDLLGIDLHIPDGPIAAHAAVVGLPDRLQVSDFEMKIGESDLGGLVELFADRRPRVDARLRSRKLNLPFLIPKLEAAPLDAVADDTESQPTAADQSARVIPDVPIDLGWIEHVDGTLSYHVDELTARSGLTSSAVMDLLLVDGTLASRELSWDGEFSSGYAQLVVTSRDGEANVDLYMNSRKIPMLWLLAGNPDDGADWTYLVRLQSHGDSLRSLAANLNGALVYKGGGGRLNNKGLDFVLGDLVGETFARLNPQMTREPFTRVVCSAGAMSVKDGVVAVVPGMVMRMDKVDIASGGSIDLRNERIDIVFNSKSRKGIGISIGKAITPYLKIGGTLARPQLAMNAASAALSTGAAVATTGLSIIAGGLWDRWIATAGDPCERLFTRATEGTRAEFLALLTPPDVLKGLEAKAATENTPK